MVGSGAADADQSIGGNGRDSRSTGFPEAAPVVPEALAGEAPPLTFDDPAMDWKRDEDPFADLGPVDPQPPAGGASAPGAGGPTRRR